MHYCSEKHKERTFLQSEGIEHNPTVLPSDKRIHYFFVILKIKYIFVWIHLYPGIYEALEGTSGGNSSHVLPSSSRPPLL